MVQTTDIIQRVTDNRGLALFLHSLDEKSRAILYFLWWHRHASIAELRNVVDTSDDYEILHRLKEVINRKSLDLGGQPIVGFEQAKIDSLSGEKVLFSWWYLNEDDDPFFNTGDLLDIFNEKETISIIAKVPVSFDISTPEIRYKNGILKVTFKKADLGATT